MLRVLLVVALLSHGLSDAGAQLGGKALMRPPASANVDSRRATLRADGLDLATALRKLCASAGVELHMGVEATRIASLLIVDAAIDSVPIRTAVERLIQSASQPLDVLSAHWPGDACEIASEMYGEAPNALFEPRDYAFSAAPLKDALLSIMKGTGLDYCLVYRDAKSGPLATEIRGRSPMVALQQVLRQFGGGREWKVRFQGRLLAVVAAAGREPTTLDVTDCSADLSARRADVRYVLRALMVGAGMNYALDVGIQGDVAAEYHGVFLKDALTSALDGAALPIRCRTESGVVYFLVDLESAAQHPEEPEGDAKAKPRHKGRIPWVGMWESEPPNPGLPIERLPASGKGKTVGEALHEIFGRANVSYAYRSDGSAMSAKLEENLASAPLWRMLRKMAADTGAAGHPFQTSVLDTGWLVEQADNPDGFAPSAAGAQTHAMPDVEGQVSGKTWTGLWESLLGRASVDFVVVDVNPDLLPIGFNLPEFTLDRQAAVKAARSILARSKVGPDWFARGEAGILVVGAAPRDADDSYYPRVTLLVENRSVDDILRALFAAVGGSYRAGNLPKARLSARIGSAPFLSTLHTVLRAAYGKQGYTVSWDADDICHILPVQLGLAKEKRK